MIEMIKYTVFVKNVDSQNPLYERILKSEKEAVLQAQKWAEEHPNELVFVRFDRSTDGQTGYINPDGASITGKSWTTPGN